MTSVLRSLPSPLEIRRELEDMVLSDLLGPVGGEREEIDEQSVRDRYLIGMLAPRRQELSPEEFDDLPQGGSGSIEDGSTDLGATATKTMFPSSFGMTFSVCSTADTIRLGAHWGHYYRERSATLKAATGEPKLVWKRAPRGGVSEPIRLEAGRLLWTPDPDFPEVQVQGLVRKLDSRWSITLFLVNGQEEPKKRRDSAWLFQPEMRVEAPDGSPIFECHPQRRTSGKGDPLAFAEDEELALLYRRYGEFGVGHGVSIHAERPEGLVDRATRLLTRVVPAYEVPRSLPPTVADLPKLDGLVLDMKVLGEAASTDLVSMLRPVVAAYSEWIAEREGELSGPDFDAHRQAGKTALSRCRATLGRIEEGLGLLAGDEMAAEAFRFANLAMWQQRVHGLHAQARRRGQPSDLKEIDQPKNRSWYPFQLAFMLLNLPGITKLDHPDRTGEADATADLLWFPTGGGKTEAYLGLSAYTLGLRRLQGTIAGRSGEHGVSVLMRYTLRLLTIQQFQRAAALVCACEVIRREDEKKWGAEPFRIGLWVGQKNTPNTTEQAAEAVQQDHGDKWKRSGSGSPAQLTNCPWCGAKVDPGKNIRVETFERGRCRTVLFCGDPLNRCPFAPKNSPLEGIPVLVVDEEIYRRVPSLLIATVDKFAQMPWNGRVQMLFGQVEKHCPRHGFVSPEIKDTDSHPKKDRLPAVRASEHPLLRPPDLIVQDELHLISGPLGSLVGLYETAVDKLCTWEVDGKKVRPKVIASTATIRKAGDQVHALFLRRVNVFPPNGLDVADNFFAVQREPGEDYPGRRYVGICAPGRRLKVALIRVYVALLSAAQTLYEKKGYGKEVDPYMTLVGYFNSMRELGGMRRLVDDDVRTRLGKMDQRGLSRRNLYSVDELTSRKDSTDIPDVLDHLETLFDPDQEARFKQVAKSGRPEKGVKRPLDVLLATNMVSVGVDVPRLGVMVVAGQPKTTAEYIQATSRVGRRHPGLVFTVYNWTRPRDLSHYESFEHYHATFYKYVEALSVTPFAPGALSRGLTALLVSCVRLQGTEFNANKRASRIDRNHPYVKEAIETILRRSELVGSSEKEFVDLLRTELNERVDQWLAEAQKTAGGRVLGYDEERDGVTVGLMRRPSLEPWDDFTCLNSLRDVEPTVGLILEDGGLDADPHYVAPASDETGDAETEEVEG